MNLEYKYLSIDDGTSYILQPNYLICLSTKLDIVLCTKNVYNYLDNTNANNLIHKICSFVNNYDIIESYNYCLLNKPAVFIETYGCKNIDRIEYVIYH